VERLAAGSRVTGTGLIQGSRTAATRIAAVSRVASERLAADLRADAISAVETAKVLREGMAVAAMITGHVVREKLSRPAALPAISGEDPVERVALEPMEASARASRAAIAASAAALAAALAIEEREADLVADAPAMEPAAVAAAEPDPDRAIEMEIDGDFSFPFELTVGATLLITETGHASADIAAVHAIILGQYTGTLRATRSIRVGATGRVDGVLEAPEVEIAEGAVVNGLRAGGQVAEGQPEPVAEPAREAVPEPARTPSPAPGPVAAPDDVPSPPSSELDGASSSRPAAAPVSPSQAREVPVEAGRNAHDGDVDLEEDDEIFVASPTFTEGVSRG
jgi:cytoskeletal protein CcmA (bactofilin family)